MNTIISVTLKKCRKKVDISQIKADVLNHYLLNVIPKAQRNQKLKLIFQGGNYLVCNNQQRI